MVSEIDRFIFFELNVQKVNMKNKKISKLSNHDKLINLIAVQGEKDVNHLLQSVDQIFIEVFKLKQKDLPWLSNNSEEEWDNVMRKVRLAIFKLYFEYVKKRKDLPLMDKITEIRIEEIFDEENNQHYYWIYYYKNEEVKIIGKSSVNPQCYRQIARYVK